MEETWSESKLAAVRDQHDDWLMQQPSVMGSSIGYDKKGRLCVKILTDQADAKLRNEIEKRMSGVPIDFEESGPIEAL